MLERTLYLNQLIQFKDSDFIKVVSGVRRSGKTVLLMLYKEYLLKNGIDDNHVVYLNFESFEYQTINTEEKLYNLLKQLLPSNQEKIYLLLDEIGQIDGWQRIVNGVRVSYDCDIVITGSNANMLSGELATLLSGRYVEITIYPFSFKEFLEAKKIDIHAREVDHAYLEYETYGGFPSVIVADRTIKDTILSGIFDSIVLNDVALRSGVKDSSTLKSVIRFLADNVGQLVNVSKIVNTLKSEGIETSSHTVNRYLEILEDAFLFYRIKQYDLRGREYLRTNGKYFIVDMGLRRNAIGRKDGNYSNRLENIVFLELLRCGYRVDIGKINNKEIDFIARKVDKTMYIQVAYELPNSSRESDNLLHIKDNYEKVIILGKYPELQMIDGIKVVYVVDWLLDDEK